MLLRCALNLRVMGKCGVILIGDYGVRSISVTTRDGVLLKAVVKVRGGASVA